MYGRTNRRRTKKVFIERKQKVGLPPVWIGVVCDRMMAIMARRLPQGFVSTTIATDTLSDRTANQIDYSNQSLFAGILNWRISYICIIS